MAVLTAPERVVIHADLMAEVSRTQTTVTLSKAALRAAVDATDAWLDANAGSFNTGLPVAARTALTAKQKAQLLVFVIRRRFEVA